MKHLYAVLVVMVFAHIMVAGIAYCDRAGSTPNLRMIPPGVTMAYLIHALKQVR